MNTIRKESILEAAFKKGGIDMDNRKYQEDAAA